MHHSSLVRTALVVSFGLSPGLLPGQSGAGPRTLCWLPAPKPACSIVLLTNVGLYVIRGGTETATGFDPVTEQPTGIVQEVTMGARAIGDWGLLFNVGRRDAVGFSVFGSVASRNHGHDSELVGLVRYRRWFGARRSLDLAVGTPLVLSNSAELRAPYGLVKFNFDRRLGVAIRPELHRSYFFTTAPPHKGTKLFLSAGIEMGEKPGFVLSALGAIILGVRTLITISTID